MSFFHEITLCGKILFNTQTDLAKQKRPSSF
ncbi:hypothetical protein CF65_01610 [Aggregatibacter actinomycetemcomitans HK1651]|nr:hypothetical protein CF65_01610 [Aggregatibacter actinomycetemcomitans HK1651]